MQNTFTRERESGNREKSNDYNAALQQGEEKIKDVISDVEKKLREGQERIKQFVTTADKKLKKIRGRLLQALLQVVFSLVSLWELLSAIIKNSKEPAMSGGNGDRDIGQSIRLLEEAIEIKKERLKASIKKPISLVNVFNQTPYSYAGLQEMWEYGKEKLKPVVSNWRREIEKDPVAVLGKVAMYSFCAGFILSTVVNINKRET